jgi:hypothetical protein
MITHVFRYPLGVDFGGIAIDVFDFSGSTIVSALIKGSCAYCQHLDEIVGFDGAQRISYRSDVNGMWKHNERRR